MRRSTRRALSGLAVATLLLVGGPVGAAPTKRGAAAPRDVVPMGLASSKSGALGLMNLESAIIAPRGTFSVLATLDYWSMQDFFALGLNQQRMENRGGFSLALADYWELFITGLATSHLIEDEIQGDTILAQSIGDFSIGNKFSFRANPFFWLGMDFGATFRTKRGGIGPDFGATGFFGKLLFTFDWTTLPRPTPVRLNLNVGYLQDQAYRLLGDAETGDPISRYALGIPYDNNAIVWGLSFEIPQPVFDLFLEYSMEYYIDLDGSQPDYLPKRTYMTSPQRFTPGVRLFPARGMHVDLAVDLGHNLFFEKARYDITGLGLLEKIEPDWVAHVGVGYLFLPPKPELPKLGRVWGVVYDGRTRKPLAGARISFPGRNLTALVTGKSGKYRSYQFEGGRIRIRVDRDGFASEETIVTIVPGQEVRRDFVLRYVEKAGELFGQISNAKGDPLPGEVAIVDAKGRSQTISADPRSGQFQVKLAPGIYTVTAKAVGFQPQKKRVKIVDRKKTIANFVLQPVKVVGVIEGTVRDPDGRPVPAIVEVRMPGIQPVSVDPRTGAYKLELPPGSYILRAYAPDYEPAEKTAKVAKNARTIVDFILEESKKTGKLIGRVIDAKSKKGVYAVVSFPNGEAANIPTDPDSGQFVVELPAGTYVVKAANPNYKSAKMTVKIEKGKETRVTFELKPYEKVRVTKEKIEIKEKIHFQTGKATIKVESYPILDEIAQVLKENPEMKVIIEGHTDSVGDASFNRRLSQRRAEAVRDYLISRGISPDRLTAVGYGEERPIASNATEEGRAKNRRVEFKIVTD